MVSILSWVKFFLSFQLIDQTLLASGNNYNVRQLIQGSNTCEACFYYHLYNEGNIAHKPLCL